MGKSVGACIEVNVGTQGNVMGGGVVVKRNGRDGRNGRWPKRANCVHCISSVVKCHKLIRRKCFVSARDCA